jgi:integrase
MSRRRRNVSGDGSVFPYRNGFAGYAWVNTTDGRRIRRWVYGKTREEVHAKWIELTRQAQHVTVIPPTAPKLGDYLQRWLRDVVQANLAPLTYATYETLVRLYITPGIGNIRIDRLRARELQTWLNSLAHQCQCCAQGKDAARAARTPSRARCCAIGQCCQQVPSPRTIRDIRTVLRSALTAAMNEEVIDKNVATLVKTPRVRRRKVEAWTSEEARRFLESAHAAGDSLYAMWVLILVLGLRKGEVLGLAWTDVDLDKQELSIARQLQRVHRELLLRDTKTDASDATLPLPDLCARALTERRMQQAAERDAAEEAWRGGGADLGLVFTGEWGAPVDPRTVNRRLAARCKASGVRPLRVHDARKTCATLLVDLDVHPRVIMRILRHADLAVTMEIYAHASSNSTREALRRLGEALG